MEKTLFILILYQVHLNDSPAYKALQQYLSVDELHESVFVHDNTVTNLFLAKPYNLGVQYARGHNKQWIVLLDQDTVLTKEYIDAIRTIDGGVVGWKVYVPLLHSVNNKSLSPFWISSFCGLSIPYERRRTLFPHRYLSAFNSGTVIPLSVIDSIGGFNEDYPINGLDHWVFWRCACKKVEVSVLPVVLIHDLSVADSKNYVSLAKYDDMLSTEVRLVKEQGHLWEYRVRLMVRIIKWVLTRHPFVGHTIKHLVSLR